MPKSERQKAEIYYRLLNEQGLKEPKRSSESAATDADTKTVRSAQFLEVSETGACGGRASDIECTIFSPLHWDQSEGHENEELKTMTV